MEFRDRLKDLREQKQMTQEDLGELLSVTKGTISKYENGNLQPSNEALKFLADFFNVTTDFLLGRTDIKNPYEPNTIAAHHDGEEWTEEELKDIEKFKEFVKSRRAKED